MIDVIIVAVIAIAVFFIVRRELRRLRKGQCCGSCSACGGDCKCCEDTTQKTEQ